MSVYFTAITLLGAVTLVTAGSDLCPSGWVHHGSSCYLFVTDDTEDWMVAMFYCNSLNAKLVEIETRSEDDFLRSQLSHRRVTGNYWIGLSDIQREGKWVWSSTQTVPTYTHWFPGQPDNTRDQRSEDCVHMHALMGFLWNDFHCNAANNFICEQEMNVGMLVG
ncbi:perlucin-like [Saccostrea cucullata]|uniref:perlucin-like n=1 Tax=Saccostrea cuccullata TaxID=36930 RepID=UPI002ED0D465